MKFSNCSEIYSILNNNYSSLKVIHVHGLSMNIETPNYTHKLEENLIYDLIMISTNKSL